MMKQAGKVESGIWKVGIVAPAIIPSLGSQRQQDHYRFKASMVNVVSSRSSWARI